MQLVIEGVTLIPAGCIDLMLSPEVRAHALYATWFRWEFIVHTMGDCAMLALYPPFLATALSTPLTRSLSDPRVRWGLATVAAALVVFFMAPLQRFAERIASAAMPNTHDTPQYAAFRKLQVYQAAALAGGTSTSTPGRPYLTSSISPGRQVLSNQGSSGPYSRRIMNQPFPGIVCTQLFSLPAGALGPK